MNEAYLTKNFLTKIEFKLAINLVDKRLSNLDKSVATLKDSVANLKKSVESLNESVVGLKETVGDLKESFGSIKNTVLRIEERLNYYGDMYEINKWHAEKLAKRLSSVEKHNSITPPQDLLISGI